ncbi:MAG: PAS domain-containing protein, partial [Burkholderiales bacterium]
MKMIETTAATAGLQQGTTAAGDGAPPQRPTMPPLAAYFDCSPVPTFAIDMDHVVTHWNKACEQVTGRSAAEMIGSRNHWQPFYAEQRPGVLDLIVDGSIEALASTYYQDTLKPSPLISGAYEAEAFFPKIGNNGCWYFFSAAPLRDSSGHIVGAVETLQDITLRKLAEQDLRQGWLELEQLVAARTAELAQANIRLEIDIRQREDAETELLRRNAELTELNAKLLMAQQQLLQSEKLASIGQLAAGVAHEINNPIGYIFSNFNTLEVYIEKLLAILKSFEDAEADIASPDVVANLHAVREHIELDFLKDDIPVLIRESKEGIVRVRQIVQDLKDFSRIDGGQNWQWANLHQGIDSTLNVVNNEIKYKA